MINVSLCPNPYVKSGQGQPYDYVVKWLKSIAAVAADLDASGGKLKAALTSSTPLFVTSAQYTIGVDFTCLNVMVDRQDYRLIIGYNNEVARVETLDARAARAQTRDDVGHFPAPGNVGAQAPAGGNVNLGENPYANNPMAEDPYANNPMGENPYGNRPSENPYGVPIPAPENPYGVRIPANH
jgi:hypothetical protein